MRERERGERGETHEEKRIAPPKELHQSTRVYLSSKGSPYIVLGVLPRVPKATSSTGPEYNVYVGLSRKEPINIKR
jgi:hypothetical protein